MEASVHIISDLATNQYCPLCILSGFTVAIATWRTRKDRQWAATPRHQRRGEQRSQLTTFSPSTGKLCLIINQINLEHLKFYINDMKCRTFGSSDAKSFPSKFLILLPIYIFWIFSLKLKLTLPFWKSLSKTRSAATHTVPLILSTIYNFKSLK